MYAPWMRICRSLARSAPKAHIATRNHRLFHASATRPAPAPPPDGGNGSDKPEKEGGKDENLFSENGATGGESQGGRRQRRSAFQRVGNMRNKEELPPVQIPCDFAEKRVFRYNEEPKVFGTDQPPSFQNLGLVMGPAEMSEAIEFISDHFKEERPDLESNLEKLEKASQIMLDSAAWTDSDVSQACKDLQIGELSYIAKRGQLAIAGLVSLLFASLPSQHVRDFFSNKENLEKFADFLSDPDLVSTLTNLLGAFHYQSTLAGKSVSKKSFLRNFVQTSMRSNTVMQMSFGGLHYDCIQEAVSQIRADLAVEAPKSIKTTDLRRPITIIHVPYYSGFMWPKQTVEEIAKDVKADVLHLTAYDIARIAGSYLGQDATIAPGPISLLGYAAADNSGRMKPINRVGVEEPDLFKSSISILLPNRIKDLKKSLFHPTTTERTGDMWDDMKINVALKELVHTADVESSELRSLIVHLHDFNALNMDTECGASVITKIRKVIDLLWLEGHKVILVGTCSSRDAPPAYLKAVKELEASEQVITLHTPQDVLEVVQDKLNDLRRDEFLAENTTNLENMLDSMLRPSYEDSAPPIDINLHLMEKDDCPMLFSTSILPQSEIHRIAKTMVGLGRLQKESLDQSVLEDAIDLLQRIDQSKGPLVMASEAAKAKMPEDILNMNIGGLGPRMDDNAFATIKPEDIKTTFDDVHVPQETIESIKMLTQLSIIRPEAFSYGVLATDRIPGCLLYGPPGTGKTLLAKAVAKESGANMIEVSGASINDMWFGNSEKNVKKLFSAAKKREPMVIFIDEADALLGSRGRDINGSRRTIINQFLREWDGMESMKAFILVATNRPFDLDDAVLRRLPRKLLIDLPLEQDRAAILKIHLKGESLDDTVDIGDLAKRTQFYSGSDLKNVCVSAAMAAVKEEIEAAGKHTGTGSFQAVKRTLNRRHFDKALSEISASVSEDMATLNAVKNFDENYGDGKRRKKRGAMGFGIEPDSQDSDAVRVRNGRP